jgi:predicted metal-dependent peptidase
MNSKKDIEEIRRIFSSLALLAPFTYPLISWPIIVDRNLRHSSVAAINGAAIFICVEKWNKLSFKKKLFISLHEWLHIALLHPRRIRTRTHRIFNYAADFVINGMIADLAQFEMPSVLYDPFYKDWTTEQIYKDLDAEVKRRQEQKIAPFCHICNREFHSDDKYCDDDDPSPKCPACNRPISDSQNIPEEECILDREMAINQLMVENFGAPWGNDLIPMPHDVDEQKIIDEVIKAAARHKGMRGLLPGSYEDYIEQIKRSEVPFERLLIRFAKECLKGHSDRNPYRPDPKYLPFDIFIPKEQGTSVSKIVLIVDTSGSMDSAEFEYASGHLQKLGFICDNLILMTADTKVHEVIRVKNIKHEIKKHKIKFKGRGGTDMHEAFERADALKPNIIILYSDMEIGNYPPKPKAPVIFLARERWAKHAAKNPYGFFITVKDRDVT